jgi:hypothetical protein
MILFIALNLYVAPAVPPLLAADSVLSVTSIADFKLNAQ